MFKMLKFDFYKLTHCKMFILSYLFAFAMMFLNLIFQFSSNNEDSILFNMQSFLGNCFPVLVFAVLLGTKDTSTRYMKNIHGKFSNWQYVLSKTFYIIIFALLVQMFTVAFQFAGNKLFGVYIIYDPIADKQYTIKGMIEVICLSTCLWIAAGELALMVTMCVKNIFINAVVVLGYTGFLYSLVYSAINSIIKHNFMVQPYTIFGTIESLMYTLTSKELLVAWIVAVSYMVFAYIVSCIAIKVKTV